MGNGFILLLFFSRNGTDTVSYVNSAVAVNASLQTGSATNGDRYVSIENLRGSDSNDTLTGAANNNILEGGLGNNTLVGGGGSDTASYAHATAGVTVSLAAIGAQNTIGAALLTHSPATPTTTS